MTDEPVPSKPSVLSEQLAHRVLSRAVELDLGADAGRSWGQAAAINAGVFAVFWTALGLASRLTHAVDGGWELQAGLLVAVNLGGFELARRLRARPVAFVLAVTAIAQLAEYVIHSLFGIESAQGGGTHFVVLLAAGLGVAVTHLLRPSPPEIGAETQPAKPMSRETEPPPWSLFRGAKPHRRGPAGAARGTWSFG